MLKRSLILLLTIACMMVLVSGVLLSLRQRDLKISETWISHSHEVLGHVQGFYGNIERMIALQRGYLLSGQDRFLNDYNSVSNEIVQDTQTLTEMTADNKEQQKTLFELDKYFLSLKNILDAKIVLRTQSNAIPGADISSEMEVAKEIADKVRSLTAKFTDSEQALLRSRLKNEREQQVYYFYALFALAIVSVIIMLAANGVILTLAARHRSTQADLSVAEEDLLDTKERLELALKGTSDGIFDWDLEENKFFFSDRLRAMLGYAHDDFPDTVEAFSAKVHPDDRKQNWDLIERYLNGEETEYRNQIRMHHKDGTWRWHLVRATALFNEKNKGYRFVGAHTDITREKMTSERLRASNKELEEFTYIASHDLRSPLVNLKGFAGEIEHSLGVVRDFMQSDNAPAMPEPVKEAMDEDIPQALSFIKTSVTKMEKLTRAILELSRVGRRRLVFEPLDTRIIVENCLKTLQHQIKEKNIEVVIGDLPDVSGDSVAIEQVFGNIIDNAIKYLSPERRGRIEIFGTHGASEVVYHIKDNGRGIRQEDLNKVFELFKRAGNNNHIPGEGMGMSYVQTTIRRHGGQIWCESELNQGTEFYFAIPHNLKEEENV